MARLNITVPDPLYARLERLRDRINISKVCANALEKEIAMLEGRRTITDPRIAQLLQRLQSTHERWHQRGHEDGMQWAIEIATRQELQMVTTEMADLKGPQLVNEAHPEKWWPPNPGRKQKFPTSFHLEEHLETWIVRDNGDSDVLTSEEQEHARSQIDEAAYLEGWRDAIKEIWEAIAPSLQ